MTWATAHTVTLEGAGGRVIDVQADVRQGLVATAVVGRPDAAIIEARDRCRAAMANHGFEWPSTRRVTILLSPADVPKRGSHFDLAIALAVIAASAEGKESRLHRDTLNDVVVLGELTLDGRVRPVPGLLPMALAARRHGFTRLAVPAAQEGEAALVPGMEIFGVRSLRQLVSLLKGEEPPKEPEVAPLSNGQVLRLHDVAAGEELDLAELKGMQDAKMALEVAAAGGHHVLLNGPRGAGKTSLAERLPGLLPDLGTEEQLELASVLSLAGELDPYRELDARPPFRAPHHSASKASLLGGGTGRVHPGEISRALHGVLFLDEFPLFSSDLVESLRQPLESGLVTIARGEEVATFPARAIVILAANPCPCGDYSADVTVSRCTCAEARRRQYRTKLTGPVMDRIDIVRHVSPLGVHELRDPLARPESTATVRARVEQARDRQRARWEGTPWRLNADVPGPRLRELGPLPEDAVALLEREQQRGVLSWRGVTRLHRLSWTLADLAGIAAPRITEVQRALCLRTGQPLPVHGWGGQQ